MLPDFAAERLITKYSENSSNPVNQFLLCLACCNTVIISVEQQTKSVKNPPPQTPGNGSNGTPAQTPIGKMGSSILRGFKNFKSLTKIGSSSQRSSAKQIAQSNGHSNAGFDASPPKHVETITEHLDIRKHSIEDEIISPKSRPRSLVIDTKASLTDAKAISFTIEEMDSFLEPGEVIYEAESPDEAALVYAAKGYGISLMKRLHSSVLLKWPGQDELVKVKYLSVFPFDSNRKMMSVLIATPTGSLLLTKGADSAIFRRLAVNGNDERVLQNTRKHVDQYSLRGLRTLCVAKREFNEEQTRHILDKFSEAEILREGREAELQKIYIECENYLIMLGATAIEDRLQEGVPETIEKLRSAGLAIWILTGDKLETALEISRLCNLLKEGDDLKILNSTNIDLTETKFKEYCNLIPDQTDTLKGNNSILAIEGLNLEHLMDKYPNKFMDFASKCRAVICCRTTPKCKGQVVTLAKRLLGIRTLAIGDGANDVAMIRAANVGVGITGQEGRQAVMASDFALPRFNILSRLLLVHGHISYARMAKMIEYFYYKEHIHISFVIDPADLCRMYDRIQFLYFYFSGFSFTINSVAGNVEYNKCADYH